MYTTFYYYKPTNFKLHIPTKRQGKIIKLSTMYLNFHLYFMINSNLSQVFRPGVRYGRAWVTGTSFHWFLRDKFVVLKTPGL